MKKEIKIFRKGKIVSKQISVIPLRYIFAMFLAVMEILAIIGIMVVLSIYVPYFFVAVYITHIVSIIAIVVSNDNPDYKTTWLFFVTMLPLVGFMLYFMFHKRTLPKKYLKRYNKIKDSYTYYNDENFKSLNQKNSLIASQARCLCNISEVGLYTNSDIKYFNSGEKMFKAMINELNKANKFIFLEYFIIEFGEFWNTILNILIEKVKNGVEVKIVYDDIGCMNTLPGNYCKTMAQYGIEAVLFSKLKGRANGEFNNRSHRKLLIIDGNCAFTGGVNIADEYINKVEKYGHWKDCGVKIKGKLVNEYTKLFLIDFYVNIKDDVKIDFNKYYIAKECSNENGFVIPFGDGPKPLYNDAVSKTAILNLLNSASKSVYITTPYLVIDNETMRAIENTAKRGVDVKIIVPHMPDKKLVFGVTKNNYQILKLIKKSDTPSDFFAFNNLMVKIILKYDKSA